MHLRTIVTFTIVSSFVITAGCQRKDDASGITNTRSAPLPHTAAVATTAGEQEAPPPPPREQSEPSENKIEMLKVPNDRDVFFVRGNHRKQPIIHLHGMCTEPKSDLDAFGSSVNDHGTIIALVGDKPCNGAGTANEAATWVKDPTALDERIKSAIEAVHTRTQLDLDPNDVILIGESMGAARAISLASKFPDKYQRLVLVGAPEAPSAKALSQAKAVAVLVGEKEQQAVFEKTKTTLGSQNARFWVLPGAAHGEYGNDGARIMAEAVAFVAAPPK